MYILQITSDGEYEWWLADTEEGVVNHGSGEPLQVPGLAGVQSRIQVTCIGLHGELGKSFKP